MNIDWKLKIKREDVNDSAELIPQTWMYKIQSYIEPRNKGGIYICGYCSWTLIKKRERKDEALKAYIKQEESWIEIKSGLNQKLDEEAKFIEKEAKITFDQEIVGGGIADANISTTILTVDTKEKNKQFQ